MDPRAEAEGVEAPSYDDVLWAYHGRDLEYATTDTGEQGERIRGWWRELGETGAVKEWASAKRGVTNVLTNEAVLKQSGFRAEACALWASHGAGPDFWWSN